VPENAPIILLTLILVAAVANLNLSVANVALPDIGVAFDASQTSLDLIAVGYSLGLAASVLYLGALGDRYGRKLLLILGVGLSIPACVLAAWAPNEYVLIAARLIGGLSAGMAYPTTLALITALWGGAARTKPIALWSGIGAAVSSLGPMMAGFLLKSYWWGSAFLLTLPLAAIAFVLAVKVIPSHVNESVEPVDNLGGVVSIVMVAALVLSINFLPVPGGLALGIALMAIAIVAIGIFVLRQTRAPNPLYDLHIAARRIFWVAACAGIIVFGALMGAIFIGQQFLQNVLKYSPFEAGAAMLPATVMLIVAAPRSAKLVASKGSRFTLLLGYSFCFLGFLTMLVLWSPTASYLPVAIAFAFLGTGVGLAGTPASHSLTGSVPVNRAGMASGTADLQRDLGGAIIQSIMGALLAAGYTAAITIKIGDAPPSAQAQLTDGVTTELQKSFSGASAVAGQYPQYSQQILDAAQDSFVSGQKWAYSAGLLMVALGAALVFFLFPSNEGEDAELAAYADEDAAASAA
jgi:MFS family permease